MSNPQAAKGRFIGVVPISAFETQWYPKQLLLMFDRLAIDLAPGNQTHDDRATLRQAMPAISSMMRLDMATVLSGLLASNSMVPNAIERQRAREALMRSTITPERFNASELRKKGFDAVALMKSDAVSSADASADRDAVIRITLREFPAPSDDTPFESIHEFRQDDSARANFWDLKNWMNNIGKEGLKEFEIMDQLGTLMSKYNQHFKFHKMKTVAQPVEVLVTTTGGIAEGLVRGSWSSTLKSLFSIRKEKIQLLEEERRLPGNEVAYIADAWKRFNR